MNRRQKIHWCQGQHAAAAYYQRRQAPRACPVALDRKSACFPLGITVLKLFRMVLAYDHGRVERYPNRLLIEKKPDQITFSTEPLAYAKIEGLRAIELYDHEGDLVVRQLANPLVMAALEVNQGVRSSANHH